MLRQIFLPILSIPFLLASCGEDSDAKQHSPEPTPIASPDEPPARFGLNFDNDWEKRAWIEKASQRLRSGKNPTGEEMANLVEMQPEDAVDELMKSKDFIATIFDFNLFYLGFKNDRARGSSENRFDQATANPSALNSMQEFARGGDYLKIWDYAQPHALTPLGKAQLPERSEEGSTGGAPGESPSPQPVMSQKAIREVVYARVVESVDKTIARLDDPNTTAENACAVFEDQDTINLSNAGVPFSLSSAITNQNLLPAAIDCFFEKQTDEIALRQAFINLRASMPKWIELFESLDSDIYAPKDLAELRTVDTATMGLKSSTAFSDTSFWFNLQNSSTNLNRRRAAYVLRRYFCDDLTPINVQVPENHAQDRHAAEPSCAACHYKLDPIAGFFRNIGLIGIDFDKASTIIFDDQVRMPLKNYEKNWLDGADEAQFNIGYIRSLTNKSQNSYGSDLGDLFSIIRQAPEARQCLVKRLAEYFVDENQVFDADYLNSLTADFSKHENSSEGLKQVISKLVTSNSFAKRDPISQKCYDFAPGATAENRPPCSVAAVLKKNCANCHSSKAPAGGLNLENWIQLGDSQRGFQHMHESEQQTLVVTLQMIVDRLSTTEQDKRMPLNQLIGDADRDMIFKWAQEYLTANQKD